MGSLKFEMYDRLTLMGRRYFFRVKGGNGEIVVQSEGYTRRESAMHTIQLLRQNLQFAEIVDLEKGTKK